MIEHRASPRLAGLDGLRAIAIVLVIAYHLWMRWSVKLPPVLGELVRGGKFGVTIFFVLSGFLITHLLCAEEQKLGRIGLRRFYFRRAFRILPPALFYLAAVGGLVLLDVVTLPKFDLVYCSFFVRNLAYVGFGPMATAHFWSLSIEEQFYLVWPAVFLATRGVERIKITAALVVLAPVWRILCCRLGFGLLPYPVRTDLLYDALLVGCLLALLRADPVAGAIMRGRILQHRGTVFGAATVACIVGFFWTHPAPVIDALRLSVAFASIAVCINYLVEGHAGLTNRILSAAPVLWIGRLSYSLYLWQQLFILQDGELGTDRMGPWGSVALTVALASVSFWAVERPFLRWRDRWESGREHACTVAAARQASR